MKKTYQYIKNKAKSKITQDEKINILLSITIVQFMLIVAGVVGF